MAQLEPMKTEIEQAGAQLVYIAAEKRAGAEAGEVFAIASRVVSLFAR
jgi:F420-0:gamma-glutamyl ligase